MSGQNKLNLLGLTNSNTIRSWKMSSTEWWLLVVKAFVFGMVLGFVVDMLLHFGGLK